MVDKDVTVKGDKKFEMEFSGVKVKICGDETGFEVLNANFRKFTNYIGFLIANNILDDNFKIKIAISDNCTTLNDYKVSDSFIKSEEFWYIVRDHVKLFDGLPFKVSKFGFASLSGFEEEVKKDDSLILISLEDMYK